jgi:hypothetical protein
MRRPRLFAWPALAARLGAVARPAWLGFVARPALLGAIALGALLALAAGPLTGRVAHWLPLPPDGARIAPGETRALPLDDDRVPPGEYRLTLRCAVARPCAGLRVIATTGAPGQAPDGFDGDRPYFRVRSRGPGLLRVDNAGVEPAVLAEAALRNYVGRNDRVPRYVVFLDGTPRPRYGAPAIGLVLAAAVALQVTGARAWARGGGHTARRAAWAVTSPPLAALALWLAVRGSGHVLVLGWDTLLVLSAPAAAAWGLRVGALRATAGLRRLGATPALRRVASRGLAPLPALLPGLVLFVHLPLDIYLPNQAEFNHHVWMLLPFGGAALAWILLVAGLWRWCPGARGGLAKGCFLAGLLVLVLDLVTPVDIDVLDGRPVTDLITVPPAAGWIQGGVVAAFAGFALTAGWAPIRPLAQALTAGLIAFDGGWLATQLSPETPFSGWARPRSGWSHPPPAVPASGPNVYQIVLDAFSSQVFLDRVRAASLEPAFAGFTFFPNARANLLDTTESMPSFMTGTFPPPKPDGASDADWWNQVVGPWRSTCSTDGILEHAYQQGYTVTQYVPRLKWCPHARTTHFRVGADLQVADKAMAAFADLWLLRLAPAPAKQVVFGDDNRGPLEALFEGPSGIEWGYWSIGQMAQLVDEEPDRPPGGQYVWVHFGTPHPPSVVDGDCRYVGARWHRNPAGGYRDQATCALRLVVQLLETLERLDRLEASTIVVQSDHAVGWVDAASEVARMPAWLEQRLDAEARRPGRGRWVNNRSLALLLVKPPGAPRAPLRVDERLVSLVDLPQTLYALHGWPARAPEGHALFGPDLPPRRALDLFVHLPDRRLPPGAKRDFHLVFDGAGWRLAPDYPARVR